MRIANTGRIAGARSAEQSVAFMRSGACASRHVSFIKKSGCETYIRWEYRNSRLHISVSQFLNCFLLYYTPVFHFCET